MIIIILWFLLLKGLQGKMKWGIGGNLKISGVD